MDSMLAISPDASELAFVRADEKKKPQVWLLPLRRPGEPRMITKLEYGASAPHWRNDGKALLVTSPIPVSKLPGTPSFPLERPGREWWDFDRPPLKPEPDAKPDAKLRGNPDGDLRAIRNWLEHNAAEKNPTDITNIDFLGELALNGEITFSELFRVDLSSDPNAEPKVTQLTSTFRDHTDPVFSPDGNSIAFSSLPDSHLHPDRLRNESVLWQVHADGTNESVLLAKKGYSLHTPQFTPDGKHLVLLGAQNDEPTYREAMLGMANPDGGDLKWLTPDGEPSVSSVDVKQPGYAYYTKGFHGGEPLERIDLNSGKAESIVNGPVGVNAYAIAAGKVVYALISAANPNELYEIERQGEPRRLTELNTRWLESRFISTPEEHWLTRPDGLRVQYWVMKPVNAEPAKHYPWVLDLHGGPSAMWGPGEFTMWHEFQIFCALGYGVVYANPRGSSGYGYKFQRANYKDWGDGPMSDVMAVLDETVASYAMVDKDQLFVTGGSYAGYLTAWIVGHTNRFKAAAALRGVYDLSTFFGEGNAYRLVPEEFGGYPWDPATRKLLDHESPITYVDQIKTPLLIIHGSSDNRTGVVQGQMLFRALKQLNRPVEYVRYPGAGHEITRSGEPKQRMDHMLRIIEFFERYKHNISAPASTSTQ